MADPADHSGKVESLSDELQQARRREQMRADTLHAVIRAQEAERARIAREFHDSAGQAMASILLSLKLAEQAESLEEMRMRLADVRQIASGTAADVRRIAMHLRPSTLDDMGLGAAVERYCLDLEELTGLRIVTDVRLSCRSAPEVETLVYRIVQQALSDAARWAAASRVDLSLDDASGALRLVISDDGCGFDPDTVDEGLGMVGMRERAEMLNADLRIVSSPNAGTTVELEVPPTPAATLDP